MMHTGDHYEHLARLHRASEIRRVFASLYRLPARLFRLPGDPRSLSPSDTGYRAA